MNNKTVFITGATSGIGKACAFEFAKIGARLLLCARREELLKEIAEELTSLYTTKVHYFVLDVRSRRDVESAIAGLPEEWKKIDILVNNAGLARGLNKFSDDDPANWEDMIDTNIKGLLYVTRAVVPGMIERNRGHIINIGSIAGHEAYPKGAVYCATKHAVDAITKSIRMDLVENNIKISTIDPGAVETNFSNIRFNGDTDRAKNVYKGIEPLVGRDIADAAVYIATRPEHVNIAEMVIFPTAQASATVTFRK